MLSMGRTTQKTWVSLDSGSQGSLTSCATEQLLSTFSTSDLDLTGSLER